jgi:hypothetical protein
MKSVRRDLAQATRHHSTLPLFEFLRSETLPARDRLAFAPALAPCVMAYADLAQALFFDPASNDPCQKLINEQARHGDLRFSSYLEDLRKLGFDHTTSVTQSLRAQMREEARCLRMLGPRIAQILHGATPLEKLVLLEALEAIDGALFELTAELAARICAEGGPELRFFGGARFRSPAESGTRVTRRHTLELITLTALERIRCLDMAFRVFDMFADASTELLAHARQSLNLRSVPRLVHSALKSAT